MPRPRSAKRRGWPDYLYERDGYYSWRHPVTRTEYGLGRDFEQAREQAELANLQVLADIQADFRAQVPLIERIKGPAKQPFGEWVERYARLLERRELAVSTQKMNRTYARRAVATFGEATPIRRISAMEVSDALAELEDEGKGRTAQAFRAWLKDCFREAEVAGWVDANPVRPTRAQAVKVRRARLTLEVYLQAREKCDLPWLQHAMDLALVTAQRREEIARASRSDVHDGGWWVHQRKTGARVFIPLELRLDAVGLSLDDVIRRCRRTRVLSRYLIHQVQPYGNSPVGSRIHPDTVTRRFSELIAGLGLDWGDKTPPTFHEIRSLSERLYAEQGGVNTQELLGHKDPRMTSVYHDSRGAEWVKVRIG